MTYLCDMKVTVDITPTDYTITFVNGDKKSVEKHNKTDWGSESVEGDFENDENISEQFYYALNDIGAYEVMKQLGQMSKQQEGID